MDRHLVALVAAVLSSTASAQVASAIVREGIALPGGPVGETISSISCIAANDVGGYAVRLDSTGSGTTLSHVWGNAAGGPGSVLLTEGTHSGYTQSGFETFFGVSDTGQCAVSPTISAGAPVGSADSAWLDTTPIAIEGLPSSVPGQFWRFASRPGVTGNGIPYFVAGLTSTSGGSTQGYALCMGLAGTALVKAGDVVPGLPNPVGTGSIGFDFGVSGSGSHWLVEVPMSGATSSTDGVLVRDGVGMTIGGALVREGDLVPVSVGGNGVETWQNFDYLDVNESGSYLITGDTNATTALDEYLLLDGTMLYREGGTLDGFVLTGSIESATLNEAGDLAFAWPVTTPAGVRDAIYLNGELVLLEGDTVDLDGDGNVEPNSIITDLGGVETLFVAPNGDLFLVALIDTLGTTSTSDDVDAVFRLPKPSSGPVVYCTAGTTTNGCVPSISASAQPSATLASPCTISVASVEGQKSGLIFYGISGTVAVPWSATSTSFLCVKTPTQRTPAQSSGGTIGACDGSLVLDWNAYQLFNPGALGAPWSAGDTAWVQGWFRDPPASKTTNLSDAVELTMLP